MVINNHDDDNDGHDVDDNDHDGVKNGQDDNHDGDTGRALVETEPVRYQLEEIHLILDKENSEKVMVMNLLITSC